MQPTNATAANAFPGDPSYGANDAFIVKFDGSGTALLLATYLGGSDQDWGSSLAVDGQDNVYLTGLTYSTNFPVHNAYQQAKGSDWYEADAYLAKFTPDGQALVYSTYLGGNADDRANKLVVNQSGQAHLLGTTASLDFPLALPLQPGIQGTNDGSWTVPWDLFLTKFSADGQTLLYSTYLGGAEYDEGGGLGVDNQGNVCVAGTIGIGSFSGLAFAARLDPDGSRVLAATRSGLANRGYVSDLALAPSGDAWLLGRPNRSSRYQLVIPGRL